MKRGFEIARRACNKQADKIQSLLADNSGIAELQKECGKLEAHMDDLEGAHVAICDILEIDDEWIKQNSR